jgi:hypothetical protein
LAKETFSGRLGPSKRGVKNADPNCTSAEITVEGYGILWRILRTSKTSRERITCGSIGASPQLPSGHITSAVAIGSDIGEVTVSDADSLIASASVTLPLD